ncbi:sulfatase-like hydrolase/transferase [Candidatus Pacearchaeota archaeon]|nr:sulfatase-like hydrolase/transferase [Candidatus Pacearchaeota archaeon]
MSKRFLSEASVYGFIFFLLFYTKVFWKRILLMGIFSASFLINTLSIGYYLFTRSNFQFYVLEGFNWNILSSFFDLKISFLAILLFGFLGGVLFALFKIKNTDYRAWVVKKNLFGALFLLAFFAPSIPISYSAHISIVNNDSQQKNFFRIIELEHSGIALLTKEIKQSLFPIEKNYQSLSSEEEGLIRETHLNEKFTQKLDKPPKKIILVVAESLNQTFLSRYNDESDEATPYLDLLFDQYAHIDDFYPSAPFTLSGLSAMLCGHPNQRLTQKDNEHVCAPEWLNQNGFITEFIRGATKYYVSENIHFKKFGFQTIFAKEEFSEKYPNFKDQRPELYETWGYSDDYVFNEAIERLKNTDEDEKLFLTLLGVDTHIPGGRCYREKTDQDPEYPLPFSIQCFDEAFGQFIANLEKEGLLNEDLVVLLTSDQLYPSHRTIPGDDFKNSFVLKPGRIPFLMITKADLKIKVHQGSQIDIAGTLLDLANLDIPDYYIGKSLLSNNKTFPIGQDGKNGYMIVGNRFYPLSLDSNIRQYQVHDGPKGFVVKISDPSEIATVANQKIEEKKQEKNEESAFYKWYYSKYFGLTE